MKGIFKNSNNEIRSGWKVAGVFSLNYILKYLMIIILLITFGIHGFITSPDEKMTISSVYYQASSNNIAVIISNVIEYFSILLAIYIFLIWVDKKKFTDIGLISIKKGFKDLTIGLILGILSMLFVFFLLLKTSNISLVNGSTPNLSIYAFYGLIGYIVVGIEEELLFRGYCVTAFNQMKKPGLSIILSAIVFSSFHLLNPNTSPLGIFNVALVGILFGYMYMKTQNLWMPIGYHIAWNYFEGSVLGFNVSGYNVQSVFHISILRDNYLTGGLFGPEAGLFTTIIIFIGILLVWKLPSKNKSERYCEGMDYLQ